MSNAFGPRKPLFGPYTYRAKQNSNGDTLIAVYVGSKRIAHMDAFWEYSMRGVEEREEEVKQRGRGRSCATDLRALGAEGKYPNVLAVSHAFITDDAHKGKGVGRAMYEAMMVEGFAVRETRIGGKPGPMFFIPDECSGAGNTSAEARRVWASLVRDYPSQGTSIRVDAPPVIGSRMRRNPDLDPRLLAADGARYFSPEALAEADKEGSAYKSRTALVLMHPQDFLDMAEPGKREESQATLERVLNAGIGLADVPRLFVSEDRNDPRIAHVTGHEGRHRSRALLARGVTQMPVRIHSQTIRWSEQSDPKSWDYDEQLPERLFGEGANRRNVLPMPVPLHYPELAPRLRPARANPRRRRNPDPTRSVAFRRWFGDSKVVDAAGEPLVVYHAGYDVLRSSDGAFRLSHSGRAGMGIYFTPSFSGAERYLGRAHAMHQDHVKIAKYDGLPIPPPPAITAAYLSVQNPVIVDRRDGLEPSQSLASKVVPKRRYRNLDYELEDLLRYTRKAGYDGVFVTNGEEVEEIVVFDPRQVKSATANVGTFDPADPDLRRNPRRRRNPEDYHMRHRPSADGPLAHELWKGEYVPEDILQHPEWYTGFQQYLRGFWPSLRVAQKRPKTMLRIYRALPKPHATFREGDWVTLSRDYAQVHLDGPLGGEGHIIVAEVPADTLRFAGDDLMEWGYWGPTVEATPLKNRRRR